MRRILVLSALFSILVGCGQAARQAPTAVPLKSYRDATYGFTFKYPASWAVPAQGGRKTNIGGVPTYVVNVKTPNNEAGVQVTVDRDLKDSDYSAIPEGKIAPYGGTTLHYHHMTVSAWPSIQIQRFSGTKVDEIATITNTRQYSFQIRMVTGSPPFPSNVLAGYNTIVRTMHLPF